MHPKNIGELVSHNAFSMTPATLMAEALNVMHANRLSCLVVMDREQILGILTERDIVRRVAERGNDGLLAPATEIMSSPVTTITDVSSACDAYPLLIKARHVVVVDILGKFKGVVSQSDLIEAMGYEYAFQDKRLSEIANKNVVVVAEDCVVRDASRLMVQRNISCLIVARNSRPLGILTESDVVRLLGTGQDPDTVPLSKVMSHPVQTLLDNKMLSDAMDFMKSNRHRRVVVANEAGEVCGLLTQTDLIQEMLRHYVTTLRSMIDNIREKEENYRNIFFNAPHGIFRSTPDGRFVSANPAVARIFGYDSPGEFLDDIENSASPIYVNPGDRERLIGLLKAQGSVTGFETLFLRKDGQQICICIHAILVRDDLGVPLYAEGMLEDITTRKLAEEALKQGQRAAEAANRAKSDFFSLVSHEIRTPLNAIMGINELLRETPLSPQQCEYLDISNAAADDLLTVISDILDITKAETGDIHLVNSTFNLPALTEKVCKIVAPEAERKRLELLCWNDSDIPVLVNGDSNRLRQILLHLLHNAIKFTEEGQIVLRLTRAGGERHKLHFSVSDTGVGIPPDKQKIIVENFTRADASTSRPHGGLGLGLTIAQKLIQLMGGEIRLKSEPGVGSTFSFAVELEAISPDLQLASNPADLEGLTVLVVDDNAVNQLIFRQHLSSWGLRVLEAEDGSRARALLAAAMDAGERIDLVILDCCMPGMDGFELAQCIRKDYKDQSPPLIMLTSDNRPEEQARVAELGLAGYVVKPIAAADLREKVLAVTADIRPKRLPETGPARVSRPLRILLVDDDASSRGLVKTFLASLPSSLDEAVDGLEGIEKFISNTYDLVLMDIMMPSMNGHEAMQTMREWEKEQNLPETPIVVLTAVVSEDCEKSFQSGCTAFLTKPFHLKKFLQTIRQATGRGMEDPLGEVVRRG